MSVSRGTKPDALTSRRLLPFFHSNPIPSLHAACSTKKIQTKQPKIVSRGCRPTPLRGSPCNRTLCKMTAAQSQCPPARSCDPCTHARMHSLSLPTRRHDLCTPSEAGTPLGVRGKCTRKASTNHLRAHLPGQRAPFQILEVCSGLHPRPQRALGVKVGRGRIEGWIGWMDLRGGYFGPLFLLPPELGFEVTGGCFCPQLTGSPERVS